VHELANAALKMMFSGDASQWYRAMQMPHYNTRSMPAISLHTGMHLIQARARAPRGSAKAPGPDPCMLQTRKPLWSFTHWLVRAAPPAARLACMRARRALRGRAPRSGRSARRACARARSGRSPAGSSCTTTAAAPPTARTTARPCLSTSPATTACSTSRSTSWPARPASRASCCRAARPACLYSVSLPALQAPSKSLHLKGTKATMPPGAVCMCL